MRWSSRLSRAFPQKPEKSYYIIHVKYQITLQKTLSWSLKNINVKEGNFQKSVEIASK